MAEGKLDSNTLIPLGLVVLVAGACVTFGMMLQDIRTKVDEIPRIKESVEDISQTLTKQKIELQQQRMEIDKLGSNQSAMRSEWSVWRDEYAKELRRRTSDRFYRSDWERERQELLSIIQAQESKLEQHN